MDAPGTPCSATEDKNARDQGTNAKREGATRNNSQAVVHPEQTPSVGEMLPGHFCLSHHLQRILEEGTATKQNETQRRGTGQEREQFNIGYEAVRESDAELFRWLPSASMGGVY